MRSVEARVGILCWQDEDGGFSFNVDDILNMDLDQMDRYIRIAHQRRKERSEAIKRATSNKKK